MILIIPSAKNVEKDLQKIGNLPAVIYPVNTNIAFDYIYNQYNHCCQKVKVLCYENAKKVKSVLSRYKTDKLEICVLPQLDDLGQTISFGLQSVKGPIIINFADTFVMENAEKLENDSFYYSEDYLSELWTFFDINKGKITKIIDKSNQTHSSTSKEKLFVGVFRLSDSEFFKSCLEEYDSTNINSINSFYKALKKYSEKIPLKAICTDKWFDIGHEDRYFNSMLEVKAREFNHISIDKNRGILSKKSDDVEKFIGEIKWYLKLPTEIEYVRPRIFDYSLSYTSPYVTMEYYAYHTLHELFLYSDLSAAHWEDIFSKIVFVCNDFRKYSIKDNRIINSLEEMYLNKTIQRLKKLKQSNDAFKNFFEHPIQVNGRRFISIIDLIIKLQKIIPEMLYDVNEFTIIHGDLCFSNIMIDNNFSFIKVIDPRGKFGIFDIYGDHRYELAKLFHSVDGKYDFIIKDLFELSFNADNCSINYAIQDKERGYNLYQIFLRIFKDEIGNNLKKIELIEALLFLSMIPLHQENIKHQMAMLATGLEILNRVVDITV